MIFFRIIRKIFLIIAIILIILLSVVSFLLFTDFGHQKIIDVVNEKVINGKITFDKLSLNLLKLSVEIKNVEIFAPEKNSVISVGNIKTAIDFHALVSQKKILVKYLEINDVIVNLEFDENENLILVTAFVSPEVLAQPPEEEFDLDEFLETGILDLFANVLEIKNAEVNFVKDEISATVSKLNLLAHDIDLRKLSLDLQLSTNSVSAKVDSMSFVLDTLSLKLNGSPKIVNLDELLAVSSVKDTILLSTVVENPAELEKFNLNLTVNTSLNSLENYNLQILPKNNSLDLHTKININGNLDNPVANIDIIVDDIHVFEYSSDKISANIYIDNETITAKNLSAKNINAMNFNGNFLLDAKADLKPLFPEGLAKGIDTSGLALEKITAEAELKVNAREKTFNETINLTAKAKLQNALAKIDLLKIRAKNKDLLEIKGSYGIKNERVNANLNIFPTNIADFNNILNLPIENAIVSANASINGKVSSPQISASVNVNDIQAFGISANELAVSAEYSGSFDKGNGKVAVKLDTLSSEYQNISRFSSDISIAGGVSSPNSTINLEYLSFFIGEDDSVYLSGKYKLNGEYSADLKIDNLNLNDIAAISEQSIFGHGKIEVSAAGNINKNILPETASVSVEIDTIDYAVINDFELPAYQNIYAKIEQNEIIPSASGIISIDSGKIFFNEKAEIKIEQILIMLADAAKITIDGEISPEDISLKTDGKIILEKFTPFIDEYLDSVVGEINFGAEVDGKIKKPNISAFVNLQEIGGKIILLEQKLHNLSGKISYGESSDNILKIESVDGKIDNGDFSISGNIDLTDIRNLLGNASIKLKNLFLIYPDIATITLDGDITAQFTQTSAKLHGILDIFDAVYFQNIDASILSVSGLTKEQGTFANLGKTVSLRRQRSSAFPVDLDLTIRPRGNILVENNLAEMSLIPDITVGGTTQFPSVSGRVRVSEGEVFFNNRTFEVKQGIIDFTDPYSIRPEVNISAETTIESYNITLTISGDPQKELYFSFSSQPNLPDNDILSLILFGRIGSELDKVQGDMVNMLINSMLGNIGPDGMNIEYKDGNISMSLSRSLSRKTSIEYKFETIDGESVQTGTLTLKLSDFLKIKAFSDTRSQAGIGLEAEFERR